MWIWKQAIEISYKRFVGQNVYVVPRHNVANGNGWRINFFSVCRTHSPYWVSVVDIVAEVWMWSLSGCRVCRAVQQATLTFVLQPPPFPHILPPSQFCRSTSTTRSIRNPSNGLSQFCDGAGACVFHNPNNWWVRSAYWKHENVG